MFKITIKWLRLVEETLGSDFCFIGEEYRIQVDGNIFFMDLLFSSYGKVRQGFKISWDICLKVVLKVKERRWGSGKDAEGRGITVPVGIAMLE